MLMGVDMTVFLADKRAKLRNVSTTVDPHPHDGLPDDTVMLPWHRNPANLVVLLLAAAVLAGALGWVIGNNTALDDPDETDIGFLQDMRVHHEQAVQMSLIYLDGMADESGIDRNLGIVAREILVGQNIEVGRMIQLLRGFGESEVNETDLAMTWMGEPLPLDRMPGLATNDDLEALAAATGDEADALFVQLMSAHHEGGIHMAEHAATHAATDEVRLMATQMAATQTEEISELSRLLVAARA